MRSATTTSDRPSSLDKHEGMGLGFFIAKTLLEQTGGMVKAVQSARGRRAGDRCSWPRGAIDGESTPGRGAAE